MRILFTFAGNTGHFEPLIPLARAAEGKGHTVAFAGRPWMAPQIEAAGFQSFSAGTDRGLTPRRTPLTTPNPDREIAEFAAGFGGRIARERARDLLPLYAEWTPDVLVCEETDLGAMVAAERMSLPFASFLVIASGALARPTTVSPFLNEVRAEFGMPRDDDLAMPGRYLVLSRFPPALRAPAFPLPKKTQFIRPFIDLHERNSEPSPFPRRNDGPSIYLTLGTVFPLESGDLFARAIDGLRDLPVNLLVTVGHEFDASVFDPLPSNVRVEAFVPQVDVLPHADLVISHGGSGSVLGALAHGLPMVLIPMGADQPLNAARCVELGVARALDPITASPQEIAETVSTVLAASSFRAIARRMKVEIEGFPEPAAVVPLLEQLAAAKI